MKMIDITRRVRRGMAVYSRGEGFSCVRQMRIEPDGYNLSRFCMGAHCGTHLDSPAHFLQEGATIEAAPLEVLCGRALVLGVEGGFDLHRVPRGCERLLLRGAFAGLDEAQARTLARAGVRLLGTSLLSACAPQREAQAHRALLSGGVWLLENLALEGVAEGWYEVLCLPLLLVGLEAAPARAVLRELS